MLRSPKFCLAITLIIGIVVGILLAPVVKEKPSLGDIPLVAVDDPKLPSGSVVSAANSIESGKEVKEKDAPPKPGRVSEEGLAPIDREAQPPSIPSVYEDHLGRPDQILDASDFHEIFKSELRDESWAAAMESGIYNSIASARAGDWAVVEYVECRTQICEIAGYTHGGQHPMPLIEQFAHSGVWPGVLETTVTSRFPDRDVPEIHRFIVIMSGYDDEKVRSIIFSQ